MVDQYSGNNSTLGLNPTDGFLAYDRKQNGALHTWYQGNAVNLTGDGSTGFLLSFRTAPPGPTKIDVSISWTYVDPNNFYNVLTGTFGLNATFGTSQTDYFFPFDSFKNGSTPISRDDIGLTAVERIDFYMNSSSAPYNGPGIYQFDNISTSAVPEPSEYALIFGLGLIAFASCKRFFYSIR